MFANWFTARCNEPAVAASVSGSLERRVKFESSRVSVSCTLSMRGLPNHTAYSKLYPTSNFQQAPRTGIEPVFAWFRARCNDQQLPPRCKVAGRIFKKHYVRESHPISGLQRPTSRLRAGENCNCKNKLRRHHGLEPSLSDCQQIRDAETSNTESELNRHRRYLIANEC